MSKSKADDIHATTFPRAVAEHFKFLSSYGFRQTASSPTSVRFESPRAYVTVFHEKVSYEIDLEIGSLENPAMRFPRSTIMLLFGPEKLKLAESRSYVAQTPDEIARGVSKLASQFAGYVNAGLFDDPKLFEHLRYVSDHRLREYAEEIELSDVRKKLDAAWLGKNYARVVDLLEPVRAKLTPSELGKLDFAKKNIGQDEQTQSSKK